MIASYPLYPRAQISSAAETMVPLSLSFVTPVLPNNTTLSHVGIIIQVKASQWIPVSAKKDKSVLLDTNGQHVLLYCPVGGTYLQSTNKKSPKLLQVTAQCQPQISDCTLAQLQMTALDPQFVTPSFNSEAVQYLEKKLKAKAAAKPRPSVPLEAALEQDPQTCEDCDTPQQQAQEQQPRSKPRKKS